jgi:hypothetical protein
MRVNLLFPDQELRLFKRKGSCQGDVVNDLELQTVIAAMSRGDEVIEEVVRSVLLERKNSIDVILFRQGVLKDAMAEPETFRNIYAIAAEAGQAERQVFGGLFARTPSARLFRSVRVLKIYLELLRKLRITTLKVESSLASEGMSIFINTISENLGEPYLEQMDEQLNYLSFADGALLGAKLAQHNRGLEYRLLHENEGQRRWWSRVSLRNSRQTFRIAPRDESGARILAEIQDEGVAEIAEAVFSSAQHVKSFFSSLSRELAFYVGCINLFDSINSLDAPICWPEPLPAGGGVLRFSGLWATVLALKTREPTVTNDLDTDGVFRIVITGANSGGKSTWLKSVGIALLMMQAGMFVLADSFAASIFDGLYTHFSRGEEQNLAGGRLDEELSRLSSIVDEIASESILLMNESFSSTNEQEGSTVAEEVISAFTDTHLRCFVVTHMYQLASSLHALTLNSDCFLVAERKEDASRTYRICPGIPQPTSFSSDLYRQIGGFSTAPTS